MRKVIVAGIAVGLGLMLLAAPLRAEPPPPTPEEIAALKAHNQDVVARAQNTAGVFTVQDDGRVKHAQSGLICAAKYPNLQLWHVEVFDGGKGYDVGCDYGRNDAHAQWVSKLTIYAVKQEDGQTLDQAFAKYRAELTAAYPDAGPDGPALEINKEGGANGPFPEFRSEEFVRLKNGVYWTDTLLVLIQKGWVLEIRGTYVGKPNNIEVSKEGGADEAVNAAGDRVMLVRALLEACSTLGQ